MARKHTEDLRRLTKAPHRASPFKALHLSQPMVWIYSWIPHQYSLRGRNGLLGPVTFKNFASEARSSLPCAGGREESLPGQNLRLYERLNFSTIHRKKPFVERCYIIFRSFIGLAQLSESRTALTCAY